MRRILVLVVVAGLAIGAAEAASGRVPVLLRTPGAEFVELQGGNGRAVVTGRGALLLRVGRGRIRVVDRPGGGQPSLNDPCQRRAQRVSPTTVQILGRDIRCSISSADNGGPWQVVMRGRRISASGRVKGSLTLDAVDRGPVGQFRIAGEAWKRWPRVVRTYGLDRK